MTDGLEKHITSDPAEIAGARRAVEAFAAAAGFGDSAVADVGLCVNEAIANVIRHAYAGTLGRPIELSATMHGDELVVLLRDWGNGHAPDLNAGEPDELRPGGLGLPCLKRLLDGLDFEPLPDGMRLRMRKIKR